MFTSHVPTASASGIRILKRCVCFTHTCVNCALSRSAGARRLPVRLSSQVHGGMMWAWRCVARGCGAHARARDGQALLTTDWRRGEGRRPPAGAY
eukprot:scaffold26724_cov120-Isochrysis_galbana.AAC.7